MGKIKDIQIVLENNSKLVYQPGDVVSGIVILNVVNPVKVKGKLSFAGIFYFFG